ncbi:FadR/GntR family transcriptional regulator [Cellulomonas fimi]|uniref:FadR family transcriptional regulator n=1 Tax=Cellulomonas fimi TaxID=1708 RepID=A0A7Y0LVU1_CELFI|nr:FadR/GntR family transcriptional regulator [Cellulomonas fimi]NMR18754.1 FadR family transcriptional regulator [Cellulomonas fimi]
MSTGPEPAGGHAARTSRTDRVVEAITQLILDGRLAPGDRLPVEKDLAASLDVSRGSLREGVRALAVLGILESRQGDGTYVTSLAPALVVRPLGLVLDLQGVGHAVHLHAVRRLLETEAVGLAAAHARTTPDLLDDAVAALAGAAEILAATPPDVAGGDDDVAAAAHERFLEADLVFHRTIASAAGNPVLAALIEALAGRTARHRLWRGLEQAGVEVRTQREHEAILDAVLDGDAERAQVRMAAHLLGVEDFLRNQDG